MSLDLLLIIKGYVSKMLSEAAVGMKALILDDFTVCAMILLANYQRKKLFHFYFILFFFPRLMWLVLPSATRSC